MWDPVTHCVRWGSLTYEGKGEILGSNPEPEHATKCSQAVSPMLPPGEYKRRLAAAIPPFATLLWFLFIVVLFYSMYVISVFQTMSDMVVWAAFHPHDYTTVITFGRQHISFWRLFWDPANAAAAVTGGAGGTNTAGLQHTARLLRDKHSGAFDVSIGCCTAKVDKRIRSTSLYHCRQCSIVLKPRSDRTDYTVVCFMTHDCNRILRKKLPLKHEQLVAGSHFYRIVCTILLRCNCCTLFLLSA